jgi:hypothetical protein
MLDVLLRHKAEIVALLRPGQDGWSAADWQVFFDERAGIAEFDGGLSPFQAETNAFACCVAEWLNRNPVASSPGRYSGCAGGGHAHDPLATFSIGGAAHARLHSRCRAAWYAERKAEAVAALAAKGIVAPADLAAYSVTTTEKPQRHDRHLQRPQPTTREG